MYDILFPELLRGGSAFIPGLLFQYAGELTLDIEDLGFLSILFYCLSNSRPLAHQGIMIGQVQKIIPGCSNARINKRLNRLETLGLISVIPSGTSTLRSLLHPLNAPAPIAFTLSGIPISSRFRFVQNA